ncbi:MAG: NAD(P)-binding protein [bacterium]|nr:NAD(P)-binding protein [bacterium]
MRVAVIGAGIAGLSCADRLSGQGHELHLFDKGRGPGGRMSTRRCDSPLGVLSFDHGASHFTARGADFRQQVAAWSTQGVVAPWPAAGQDAWVGTPGMNAPVKAMALGHAIEWGCQISGLTRDMQGWWCLNQHRNFGPFDAAIIAIPAEQALPIVSVHDFQMARLAMTVRSTPCWSAMYAFAQPIKGLPDIVRHHGPIGWAVRNSAKPGRSGPETWVVQGAADWSQAYVEEKPEWVAAQLLDALAGAGGGGLSEPVVQIAHRWRYATPSGCFEQSLWNRVLGIGLCGDWLAHGYVEQAWQSGRALADRIIAADASVDTPA